MFSCNSLYFKSSKGYLDVYSDISAKADVTYRHLPVMESTSVPELIQNTLQKLGIEVWPSKLMLANNSNNIKLIINCCWFFLAHCLWNYMTVRCLIKSPCRTIKQFAGFMVLKHVIFYSRIVMSYVSLFLNVIIDMLHMFKLPEIVWDIISELLTRYRRLYQCQVLARWTFLSCTVVCLHIVHSIPALFLKN